MCWMKIQHFFTLSSTHCLISKTSLLLIWDLLKIPLFFPRVSLKQSAMISLSVAYLCISPLPSLFCLLWVDQLNLDCSMIYGQTESPWNLPQQSRVCSQRAQVCSACSCSNSALFPHGGQECRRVSPHLGGWRWNRPQRWEVRGRERAGFRPHPSLFHAGFASSLQIYTAGVVYDRLYELLSATIARKPGDQGTHRKKLVCVSSHLWRV